MKYKRNKYSTLPSYMLTPFFNFAMVNKAGMWICERRPTRATWKVTFCFVLAAWNPPDFENLVTGDVRGQVGDVMEEV